MTPPINAGAQRPRLAPCPGPAGPGRNKGARQ